MYKAAVITLSDRAYSGEYEDISGKTLCSMLPEGFEVKEYILLPDSYDRLRTELIRLCDTEKYTLILTTGGTGLAPCDITPEATMSVAERNVPGIAEAMRAGSMQHTSKAMLSRGVSVIRGNTLIINLPGSPKAVRENMEIISGVLLHAADIISGKKADG